MTCRSVQGKGSNIQEVGVMVAGESRNDKFIYQGRADRGQIGGVVFVVDGISLFPCIGQQRPELIFIAWALCKALAFWRWLREQSSKRNKVVLIIIIII